MCTRESFIIIPDEIIFRRRLPQANLRTHTAKLGCRTRTDKDSTNNTGHGHEGFAVSTT